MEVLLNYREDIETCVEYIEEHIKENITMEEVASQIGYSLYHFSRVFSLCKGISVMEYIRNRRLSLAATQLFQGRKIIDIAFDYEFETPSGFANSFRNAFGYSPTQFMKRMAGYAETKTTVEIGGYIMNPAIVKRPEFMVAGYGIKTNITGDAYTKDVASFWSNYDGENLESKMYKILNPKKHGEVGLCVPLSEDGNAIYLLGVIVEDFSKVEEDMLTVVVPEAVYAVFTTPPVDTTKDMEQKEFAKIIASTWKYIFEEWFKDSGYVYDESKLDFEYYDERCHHRQDTVMDIYVPVKVK
ncbi:transcriptional regulator, AraC family [Lachnoclostridium phytofermentans ISDg]|uniref:Transcriptional regulator, AraC family n=1 Tax=Lachnoclostridium phytofermentans (strain ATCC 700394 / DSM 18823 / ISDg) TaxID=357809 RepID=A9KR86_LACP7|nr:transcriptional regulator, AraC family [Lachnoclostridium phytofermentans ISDg]